MACNSHTAVELWARGSVQVYSSLGKLSAKSQWPILLPPHSNPSSPQVLIKGIHTEISFVIQQEISILHSSSRPPNRSKQNWELQDPKLRCRVVQGPPRERKFWKNKCWHLTPQEQQFEKTLPTKIDFTKTNIEKSDSDSNEISVWCLLAWANVGIFQPSIQIKQFLS